MKKEQALKIGSGLARAVERGLISEEQARTTFKAIARKYKQQRMFGELQKSDPALWMKCARILNS